MSVTKVLGALVKTFDYVCVSEGAGPEFTLAVYGGRPLAQGGEIGRDAPGRLDYRQVADVGINHAPARPGVSAAIAS
jgi:hypothetical protein